MLEIIRPRILSGLSPTEIVSLTIIGEGRGEPIEGQVAIGCVIRNRLHNNPVKYENYFQVCLEPKQFSCWNEDDPNYALLLDLAERIVNNQTLTDSYLKQCMFIAQGVVDWIIRDNTRNACNYVTKDIFYNHKPSWARKATNIQEKGSQVFFNA